jgi:hypothetical protein
LLIFVKASGIINLLFPELFEIREIANFMNKFGMSKEQFIHIDAKGNKFYYADREMNTEEIQLPPPRMVLQSEEARMGYYNRGGADWRMDRTE